MNGFHLPASFYTIKSSTCLHYLSLVGLSRGTVLSSLAPAEWLWVSWSSLESEGSIPEVLPGAGELRCDDVKGLEGVTDGLTHNYTFQLKHAHKSLPSLVATNEKGLEKFASNPSESPDEELEVENKSVLKRWGVFFWLESAIP